MVISIPGIFLQTNVISPEAGLASIFLGFIFVSILVSIFLSLIMYVFMGFAFSAIAKKAKHKSPGIAWIPIVGPALISSKIAKMHWWPILLLIGIIFPPIAALLILVFLVFFIIWLWKTYEAIGHPGWYAILMIIWPVGLIFLGIAAWSKEGRITQVKSSKKKKSRSSKR